MADITEKSGIASVNSGDGDPADVMMESSNSDSMEASGTMSNCPSETGSNSGMSTSMSASGSNAIGSTEKTSAKIERERRESTSSNSDVHMLPPSPVSRDQLHKRIESLQQQNRVLKVELETYKLKLKALQEENRGLRQTSVNIQAKAEQEEEFISNTLLKKIHSLKKEKETLALNYEQEEECLTNDLSRKLNQLRQEKIHLEHTLEQEQECLVNKLMRRIEKLESETTAKQDNLETLRREKVELENTLEQEQEALVNKLWKRMDQLETEKRSLQSRIDPPTDNHPVPMAPAMNNNNAKMPPGGFPSVPGIPPPGAGTVNRGPGPVIPPMPPRMRLSDFSKQNNGDTAANLANHIRALKAECARLKQQLSSGKAEHEQKMAQYAKEEKEIREENLRLQRRLQLELDRREALCRHLSESESSLEMEEERVYNELSHTVVGSSLTSPAAAAAAVHRTRTVSSPVPSARPLSPGLNLGEGVTGSAVGVAAAHLPRPVAARSSRSVSSPVPTPYAAPGVIQVEATATPSRTGLIPNVGVASRRPIVTPPQITPPPSVSKTS